MSFLVTLLLENWSKTTKNGSLSIHMSCLNKDESRQIKQREIIYWTQVGLITFAVVFMPRQIILVLILQQHISSYIKQSDFG